MFLGFESMKPSWEPRNGDLLNLEAISFFYSKAKNATSEKDLVNQYNMIIDTTEKALKSYGTVSNMASKIRAESTKETEARFSQKVSDLEQQLKSKDVLTDKLKEDLVKIRKENEKCQKNFEELQWHALENVRAHESQIETMRTEYESKIFSQQEEISKKVQKLSLAEKTITDLEEKIKLLLEKHHHSQDTVENMSKQLKSQKAANDQLISKNKEEVESVKRDYENQIKTLKSQFETEMWLKQEELSKKMKDISVAEVTITELKDNIKQLNAAAANVQDKIESQKTIQDQLTRANQQKIEDLTRDYEIKLKERSEEVEKLKNLMRKVILRDTRA